MRRTVATLVLAVTITAIAGCQCVEHRAAGAAARANAELIEPLVLRGIDEAVAAGEISPEFADSDIGPRETWATHLRLLDAIGGE